MATMDDSISGINEKLDVVLKRIEQMNLQVEVATEIITAHSGELSERELARAREFGLYRPGLSQGISNRIRRAVWRVMKRSR
jgi:AAA+ superfamily predicted ATPase